MWEHFTSKKYYTSHEIKKVGEIYTPWSSWKIVASNSLLSPNLSSETNDDGEGGGEVDKRLDDVFEKIDKGIEYFRQNKEESVRFISEELDYTEEDAREWLGTVVFEDRGVRGVEEGVVSETIEILKKAGVVGGEGMGVREMIGVRRG